VQDSFQKLWTYTKSDIFAWLTTMTAPTRPSTKLAPMSFTQANVVLDNPIVRRAYLVDAITVGLHMVNETQERDYSQMLRALFTTIDDDQLCFALFEGQTRVSLMSYSYQPDELGAPVLVETDGQRNSLGATDRTRQLQQVFDHVLMKMEKQVWDRVNFA